MNEFLRWSWIKQIPRLSGCLSIISLLSLLKRRDSFTRILSDTMRNYYMAWGKCLPAITPQEITETNRPLSLILDRERFSLGLEELIPMLEIVQLSSAKSILEIGTSSGGTTWHLAANTGTDGSIITVDLPADAPDRIYSSLKLATERPTENQLGRHFIGTPEAKRIKQVFIDSKNLLEEVGDNKFELIFIDASHTYEYVKQDTENALKLITDGGYIIWHDYFVFHPDYGVLRYLHELNRKMPVYRLCNSICGVARVRKLK